MHAITPRRDDAALPAAHRVALTGPIDGLAYPPICPACEAPATVAVEVARVFVFAEDMEETVWRYRIDRAFPLFCGTCAARHACEVERPDALDHVRTAFVMGLAIPAGFLLYFATIWGSASVGEVLVCVAAMLMLIGWRRNAWKRVPAATATTATFDFGDDPSGFRARPRPYAFASAGYAAAFASANGVMLCGGDLAGAGS